MAELQNSPEESGEMAQRFIEMVMMQAQNAAYALGQIPHPETGEALARLVDQARDCAGEIRDLINDLRPSVLDDFGFVEALKEHIAHLQTEGEFEVSLRLDEAIPQALAPEANVALFRAFQEAVMNAR